MGGREARRHCRCRRRSSSRTASTSPPRPDVPRDERTLALPRPHELEEGPRPRDRGAARDSTRVCIVAGNDEENLTPRLRELAATRRRRTSSSSARSTARRRTSCSRAPRCSCCCRPPRISATPCSRRWRWRRRPCCRRTSGWRKRSCARGRRRDRPRRRAGVARAIRSAPRGRWAATAARSSSRASPGRASRRRWRRRSLLDQITPVILTRDEEPNIARTLGQLAWAREVVRRRQLLHRRDGRDRARASRTCACSSARSTSRAAQWTFAPAAGAHAVGPRARRGLFRPRRASSASCETLEPPPGVRAFRAAFRYAIGRQAAARVALSAARRRSLRRAHASFWQDGHTQRIARRRRRPAISRTPIIHDDRKASARSSSGRSATWWRKRRSCAWATRAALGLAGRVRKLIVVAPFAVVVHTLFVKGLILDGVAGLRYAWERFVAELMLSRELLRPSR